MKSVKKVKEFFHMIITVILCHLLGVKSKKMDAVDLALRQEGTAEVINSVNNIKDTVYTQVNKDKQKILWISNQKKHHRLWKKVFFWMQGPGDGIAAAIS